MPDGLYLPSLPSKWRISSQRKTLRTSQLLPIVHDKRPKKAIYLVAPPAQKIVRLGVIRFQTDCFINVFLKKTHSQKKEFFFMIKSFYIKVESFYFRDLSDLSINIQQKIMTVI